MNTQAIYCLKYLKTNNWTSMFKCNFILVIIVFRVNAYTRYEFAISDSKEEFDLNCSNAAEIEGRSSSVNQLHGTENAGMEESPTSSALLSERLRCLEKKENPMEYYQMLVHHFMYGAKVDFKDDDNEHQIKELMSEGTDPFEHYPLGNKMRGELFGNKTAAHLPPLELMHRGHCRLNVTRDLLQTALNAYGILLGGNVDDVLALPADYVLRSARTIAMMKIRNEKLTAMWVVVKGNRKPTEISHHELEMFRPLFKYVSGREMSRLNLTDERILRFIGTHPDLDRHQMGVVASRFIKTNPDWVKSKYLNLMNNILCGIPIHVMRNLSVEVYLQLPHQTFYHIRACDSLQRRFFLIKMSMTEALGKPFSWDARDVSRLGLLLPEVDGADLPLINPSAMSGLTAHVMLHIKPCNLQYFTHLQIKAFGPKTLDIFTKRQKAYEKKQCTVTSAHINVSPSNMFLSVIGIILLCNLDEIKGL